MTACFQDPLIECLLRPRRMAELSLRDWDRLLPRARVTLLLPRLALLAERAGLMTSLAEPVQRHLVTGLTIAGAQERVLRWELQRLERVLSPLGCPVLLLKGAAYFAAGLPLAEGRIIGDIDIMVPSEALDRVQGELFRAGWQFDKIDEYDRRYYLRWMHELPPLRHRRRRTVLDVHHRILPPTSRLKPDPALLWMAARPLPTAPFLVLSPADLMLHSAAHLFQDGDLHLRLRDLFDLHEMAEEFGRDPAFWPALLARAQALDLERPLHYAAHFCGRFFGTDVPSDAARALKPKAPPAISRWVMDRLVPPTLLPPPARPGAARQFAALVLYIRSHWLRMPPFLLAAHLARKSLRRAREARQAG